MTGSPTILLAANAKKVLPSAEKHGIDGTPQVQLGDPARRRKIAEARTGKPRPRHVVEAMRKGRTGKPQSEESKQRIGAAHRRRGTRSPAAGVPWTDAEDDLVRTLPAAEVVKRTGRTLSAAYGRRSELKVPDGRRRG